MKRKKMLLSAIVGFAILFTSLLGPSHIVNADDELRASNIPLISNMVNESEITAYKYQEQIYLETSAVARLTGAELLDRSNNPSQAWFYYGVELNTQQSSVASLSSRYIVVDFDKKIMFEIAGGVQNSAPINVISQNGIQYIHAYPILTALGAMCKMEDGVLIVTTPLNSFWDALKSDSEIRSATSLSKEREYGNTASLRIGIDLFVDLFTPGGVADIFNPIGNISQAITNQVDAHVLEQSLYVSIDKYSSVQKLVGSTNMRIDSFTESFAIAKDITELSEKIGFEVVMNELVQNGLLSERGSYQKVLQALKQADNISDYSFLSDLKLASDAMTGIKAGLEFTATLSNRLGVEPARISALADTFSEENLEKAIGIGGYPRFFGNARNTAQTLAAKESTILATAAETLWNEIGSEMLSKAIITEGVKEAFGNAAGGFIAALQIEGILIKLIIPGQIESVSSDIYLYKAMAQLEWEDLIATNWLLIAKDEAYTNEETLSNLRNSLIIYYQTCLYAHELIISMIKNSPERYGASADTLKASEEADCEKIAGTLYKLYSSQPVAVPKFDSLLALSGDFDKQVGLKVEQINEGTNIFSELSETFIFASGVGAWGTEVQIKPDGTFTGIYFDSDMGVTGTNYPNGTRRECIFSGKFTSVKKINAYEYSMRLEYLNTEGTVGEEKIIDGVNVITAEPYGLNNADEFLLYLPGRSTADLPAEYLDWVSMPMAWSEVPTVLPFYGLYNVGGQQGFFSDTLAQLPNSTPKMYSSYATIKSFDPNTGLAEFDYFDRLVGEDAINWLMKDRGYTREEAEVAFEQAEPPNYIVKNVNPQLRTIDLNNVEIMLFPLDKKLSYYTEYIAVHTDISDVISFYENQPDRLFWFPFYITVDTNGKPTKIEQIFVS